ncbi:MAG: prohibitin family protein [Epsilonproteobacteria bacterium]|nr:prohibitin family protein [Campylobacterota bacterium]
MPADLNGWKGSGDSQNKFEPPKFEPPKFLKSGSSGLIVAAVLVMFLILFKPWVIINEGEVGILATTGKFSPKPLMPGLHFYVPVIQKVIVVDTKVHMISYKRNPEVGTMPDRYGTIKVYPAINVLDSRGLPITVELSVSYKLNPQKAAYVIKTYGLNWEDKIINPIVRDVVRNVIGKYPAEELPVKRNEIAAQIENQIREELAKIPNQPIIFESFQLRDIILPENIKKQIERVQIAKQEAERAKYEVLRAKQEAEKKAAIARGIAEAKKIEAQGKADAMLIEANAQAKANIIIGKSLTNELLKLKQIEVQSKFNDALKENPNAKIFLTPGGVVPNLWMNVQDEKKAISKGQQ